MNYFNYLTDLLWHSTDQKSIKGLPLPIKTQYPICMEALKSTTVVRLAGISGALAVAFAAYGAHNGNSINQ